MKRSCLALVMFLPVHASSSFAADPQRQTNVAPSETPIVVQTVKGKASVISGDTLWFPQSSLRVRLAGIEACALPQWAFDPKPVDRTSGLPPVPCGPLAKAWLKRAIGERNVLCNGTSYPGGDMSASCSVSGRDLGLEMLRLGWAKTTLPAHMPYFQAEHYARSARYGMWGTYVLDMAEWLEKAVDRTVARKPEADRNLLRDRQREITPPFADWRNRPPQTDR